MAKIYHNDREGAELVEHALITLRHYHMLTKLEQKTMEKRFVRTFNITR